MPRRAVRRRRREHALTPSPETLQLAHLVPRLAPNALRRLVQRRGLEACGPLVAAATPLQIATVLDAELWRTRSAGGDEQFDDRQFALWLETLLNEGEHVATSVVAEMDPALTIAGLSRRIRVFDPASLSSGPSLDGEPGVEAAPAPCSDLECEVGGYILRARTPDAWDATVTLLVSLAAEYPDAFHTLMQGCRRLSNSTPELDGLDQLMLAPDQEQHDLSVAREHRRTREGYVSAGDARAFLRLARDRNVQSDEPPAMNPIAAAFLRAEADEAASAEPLPSGDPRVSESADPEDPTAIESTIELLLDADAAGGSSARALLGPGPSDASRMEPLGRFMEWTRDHAPSACLARHRELAFLTNVLVAGCSVYGRPLTVEEGWNAAVGVCNLALEDWPGPPPDSFLEEHDLIAPFEAGWRRIHEEVGLHVTRRLAAALDDLRSADAEIARDFDRLQRELESSQRGGTSPSLGALDVLALLDMPTWACLRGLLSECPVLPAAVPALLDGRSASVSATAFECFSTSAQIRRVNRFAAKLGDLLI